jgi:glutathione S-transferase
VQVWTVRWRLLTPTVWLLEELGIPYDVETYLRMPTLMRAAPPELFQHSRFGKGPAVTLNGESFGESGYVIHRLLTDPSVLSATKNPDIETTPSNDSVFWAHASEAACMTWFQSSAMVGAGARAWVSGTVGDADDKDKTAIQKFAGWYNEEIIRPQAQNFLDTVNCSSGRPEPC